MITVKVAQMPGALREFVLEDGATVSEALDTADMSADGFTVSVNGATSGEDRVLADGDNVILTKAAKGNVA